MSKAQVVPGKNQLTMQNFPPSPSLVIGSELMSCALGAWWKPQGEPGTKPAHNLHLQHFCVTGWELMPCVLGGVVSKPQGEAGPKPAQAVHFLIPVYLGAKPAMHIFSISVSLVGTSCHVL